MPNFESMKMADGFAAIMGIGRARPQNCIDQVSFPDFYFRIHNNDHLVDLKFQRICKQPAYDA